MLKQVAVQTRSLRPELVGEALDRSAREFQYRGPTRSRAFLCSQRASTFNRYRKGGDRSRGPGLPSQTLRHRDQGEDDSRRRLEESGEGIGYGGYLRRQTAGRRDASGDRAGLQRGWAFALSRKAS